MLFASLASTATTETGRNPSAAARDIEKTRPFGPLTTVSCVTAPSLQVTVVAFLFALVSGDGAVEARPACTISLTFDHRVLDGAAAGRALTSLVDLLEDADALRELPR